MAYINVTIILCAAYTSWIKAVFTIKQNLPQSPAVTKRHITITNMESASKFNPKSCPVERLVKSNTLKQTKNFTNLFSIATLNDGFVKRTSKV